MLRCQCITASFLKSSGELLSRAAVSTSAVLRGDAGETPSTSGQGGGSSGDGSSLRQRRFFLPRADSSFQPLNFKQLHTLLLERSIRPQGEGNLLLLINKAQSAEEVEAALKLVHTNWLRRGRHLQQHATYSSHVPGALLRAAQRSGAPPTFSLNLLERAAALGLKPTPRLCQEVLLLCAKAGDTLSLGRAWLLAQLHSSSPPSPTALVSVLRGLHDAQQPRQVVRLAQAHAGVGGRLSPAAQRLLERAQAELAGRQRRKSAAPAPADGA